MKALDFARAASLAKTSPDPLFTPANLAPFEGCGLPGFAPVFVTLAQVAAFVRWQALQFDGEFDAEALAECAAIARKKFFLIGADSPAADSQPPQPMIRN